MSFLDRLGQLEREVTQLEAARMEEARESDRLRADIVVKARLLTAQTKEIGRLRAALEKIACRHVTEAPLWWQQEARDALSSSDRGPHDLTKSTTD